MNQRSKKMKIKELSLMMISMWIWTRYRKMILKSWQMKKLNDYLEFIGDFLSENEFFNVFERITYVTICNELLKTREHSQAQNF